MQQKNGLSIVFYPTFPSTRKRLHIHTWPTEYESKTLNRVNNIINAKPSNCSLSFNYHHNHHHQHHQQQQQQQKRQEIVTITNHQLDGKNTERQVVQKDDIQEECSEFVTTVDDGFSKIPHEIMMIIMDDLEVTDIISLSMVNRKLRAHTQDNYLWRQILLKKYGETAIRDYNDKLLSSNNPRKGKWKCKSKQIPSVTNWQKVYMNLSTVKIKTKTAFSRGKPGTFYRYRHFDIKDNEPSNNRVRQRQRSFNIEMTISNVPPGLYDVIWRMRVDKCPEKPVIVFSTDIWLRHDIYLSSYEREAKYKYSPDPEEISKAFDKGWFHFRLPYQIEIAKIEHSEERRYQVHTGIYCYTEKLGKSSSAKGPFSVDSVCLRPHIPYNHCPINNDLTHTTVENEGESLDKDIGGVNESTSVDHKGCNMIDKTEYNIKKLNSLIKHKHKRLSRLLCV